MIAAAALDPDARIWLLDGKLVELAAWAPVAQRVVGPNGEEAIELLREVRAEMDERYRELLARGQRKIRRERRAAAAPGRVRRARVLSDGAGEGATQEFAELLRDLVARGRAAGVIVCAATQKPGADVVPSALRDLFGFRLAMRCTTPQASDTILGQGWASNGADASDDPGRAARCRLPARRGRAADPDARLLPRRRRRDGDRRAGRVARADAWLAEGVNA